MSEGTDRKSECEHAWVHKGTNLGLWIPQCCLCGDFDNTDLRQQVAKVKAEAWDEGFMAWRDYESSLDYLTEPAAPTNPYD